MSSDPCNWVHGLRVNAGVVCWQLTLRDPHLSELEVRFSRRCAIQIDVYLTLYQLTSRTNEYRSKVKVKVTVRVKIMVKVRRSSVRRELCTSVECFST